MGQSTPHWQNVIKSQIFHWKSSDHRTPPASGRWFVAPFGVSAAVQGTPEGVPATCDRVCVTSRVLTHLLNRVIVFFLQLCALRPEMVAWDSRIWLSVRWIQPNHTISYHTPFAEFYILGVFKSIINYKKIKQGCWISGTMWSNHKSLLNIIKPLHQIKQKTRCQTSFVAFRLNQPSSRNPGGSAPCAARRVARGTHSGDGQHGSGFPRPKKVDELVSLRIWETTH